MFSNCFSNFYNSGQQLALMKLLQIQNYEDWRLVFILFERNWIELSNRILIIEIVQIIFVLCYNLHYILSSPRILHVIYRFTYGALKSMTIRISRRFFLKLILRWTVYVQLWANIIIRVYVNLAILIMKWIKQFPI